MPTFSAGTGRTGTVQSWTVPTTGPYKIECRGAQGGSTGQGTAYAGGKGAYRYGTINLTAGDVIKIIVGHRGGTSSYYDGGGGGGSFVYKDTGADLLCAAGGGGGASINGPGRGGVITTSGTPGLNGAADYGTAGTAGNGGSGGYSASGAGWLGNGGDNTWSAGNAAARPGSACKPGLTYVTNGGQAVGGEANSYAPPSEGGFGGGAGAHGNYIGGGGGGGYSGGAGGASGYGGGGGGSFTHASMTDTGGTADTQLGAGQVVITLMNLPPTAPTNLSTPRPSTHVNDPMPINYQHNDPDSNPQSKTQARWRKAVV